ncbi:MAG: hypothetical protein LPK88_14005 [Alphaproteobacteria bacterium]|nr:hypothetical protein [Alphaproteobacteria bacterium]
MNYATKEMRTAIQAANTRREFATWLLADADRLASAARLLGGDPWERRAARVADAIASAAEPEEVESDLRALHRLLTLEFTDDLDSPEAALFFDVHPDDPRADDARLCAESLERGLEALHTLRVVAIREVA